MPPFGAKAENRRALMKDSIPEDIPQRCLAAIYEAVTTATTMDALAAALFVGGFELAALFVLPCGPPIWIILNGFHMV